MIDGETEALPLVVAAAEGADALDAELVEGHGGFGGGGFAGAGAEEDDVAVAGDLVMTGGERVGREVERAGEGERVGEQFEGMAQIDDVDGLAGIELALEVFWLKAGGERAP